MVYKIFETEEIDDLEDARKLVLSHLEKREAVRLPKSYSASREDGSDLYLVKGLVVEIPRTPKSRLRIGVYHEQASGVDAPLLDHLLTGNTRRFNEVQNGR